MLKSGWKKTSEDLSAGTEIFQSIETRSQTDFELILIQSIDSYLLIAIAPNVFLSVLKCKSAHVTYHM